MTIEKGWDKSESKEYNSNKTIPNMLWMPEKEERTIVFLDSDPVWVSQHHYFDPRIPGKDGKMGRWGNYMSCLAGDPNYPYCPALNACLCAQIDNFAECPVKFWTAIRIITIVMNMRADKYGSCCHRFGKR